VGFEPGSFLHGESVELRGGSEALEGLAQERLLARKHALEIDAILGKAVRVGRFEADQQGIAGKRGEELVRRLAIAGRSKRQHLPESLAGIVEPIGKAEGGRA